MTEDVATREQLVDAAYAEHGPALRAFCLHATRDPQLADDIVQEVLLRAWRSPQGLDPERGSVRAWLFTVARHLLIDRARARSARPIEVSAEGTTGPVAPDDVDRALERWQITDALGQLSKAHRDVLIQLYYLDRSVAEAAQVLDVPPGTVKSRAYYALRAMRLTLQEAGATP